MESATPESACATNIAQGPKNKNMVETKSKNVPNREAFAVPIVRTSLMQGICAITKLKQKTVVKSEIIEKDMPLISA